MLSNNATYWLPMETMYQIPGTLSSWRLNLCLRCPGAYSKDGLSKRSNRQRNAILKVPTWPLSGAFDCKMPSQIIHQTLLHMMAVVDSVMWACRKWKACKINLCHSKNLIRDYWCKEMPSNNKLNREAWVTSLKRSLLTTFQAYQLKWDWKLSILSHPLQSPKTYNYLYHWLW